MRSAHPSRSADGTTAAFEHYAALVRQADDDPTLRLNPDHNIATVRAWQVWRDAYLADEAAAG